MKRHARAAGLDPTLYAGHSLRSGLATSAVAADVPERVIAQQTGHKSMTVLRRYIRSGSLFRENAAARVGLCSPGVVRPVGLVGRGWASRVDEHAGDR